MIKPAWILLPVVIGAAGCSGSDSAPMSAQEKANFAGGGPTGTRSAQQQAAIDDFRANFNKMHPPHDGGQGGPPAGQPPK